MKTIKNYIFSQVAEHNLTQEKAKEMLIEIKNSTTKSKEEIAIIGMSGKFPKAENLDEYWDNIKNNVTCIGELPKERVKDVEDFLLKFHRKELLEEGAIKEDGHLALNYEIRGYVKEIDKFDADFFGIPPREAKTMDPDQRIFLQTAYEAIESAGYSGNSVYGSNTGVFVGIDHVSDLKYKQLAAKDPMVVTGTWPGILASRLSYIYNFSGPSMVIDTACSSGLVSIHNACNSLRNGECDMAIAGGLSSFYYRPIKFKSELKELDSVESKDNTVRTFDKKANGTVWGEGVGAVLLKPLSKAISDGDVIHAVIKGSSINNDGASNGITAPDAEAQESLLLNAWKNAEVDSQSIQYIEVHGTGTVLGDPIEIKSMTKAFKAVTDKKQFCGVGTVKTSIGHLVGASGLASILKVIMMLKNKSIPKSLNFDEPNPFINFCDSPVYVTDKNMPWYKGETPRRAGINSFGFSGTNCHVILEEAPEVSIKKETKESEFEIFTISTKSRETLKQLVDNYLKYFEEKNISINELAYTSNTGRGHYSNRLIILAKDYEELKEKIKYVAETGFDDICKFGVYYGEHKLVSDNKPYRESGEISEAERRKLTRFAEMKLLKLKESYDYPTAAELCDLYIKGAKIEWESLYEGKNIKRVSLPVYPLQKTRYWYDEKVKENNENIIVSKTIKHPLVDRCLAESIYEDIYVTQFSTDRQWVVSDHKILGNYVIPGTTYIEMAIETCRKHFGYNVEIKDVIYYSPVSVVEHEVREVQSIIVKKEDHFEITFASKINEGEINEKWIRHVECKAYKNSEFCSKLYDIKAIEDKLVKEKESKSLIDMTPKKNGIDLGERWQNEKIIAVGKNEALVKIQLPEHIAYDVEDFCLHVSMLDNAVNSVSQKIGKGLYLPFYYKSIKVFGKMKNNFYSYIRINEKLLKGMETITFDVSLLDEDGKAFAEVKDYSIKKVDEAEFIRREQRNKSNAYSHLRWVNCENIAATNSIQGSKVLIFTNKEKIGEDIIQNLEDNNCSVVKVQFGEAYERLSKDKFVISGEEDDYVKLTKDLVDANITHIIHAAALSSGEALAELNELDPQLNKGVNSLFYLTKALVTNKYNKKLQIVVLSNYSDEVTGDEKTIKPENSALFGLSKIIPLEYSQFIIKAVDIDDNTDSNKIINEIRNSKKNYKVAYRNNRRYEEELDTLTLEESEKIQFKENGAYVITGGTGGLGLEMGKYLASKKKVNIVFINRSKLPNENEWEAVIKKGDNKKILRTINGIKEMQGLGAKVKSFSGDVTSIKDMEQILMEVRKDFGNINGIIHCAGLAGDGFIMRKDKEVFNSVLAPKVKGTFILDKLTQKDNLDFFVLFSSMLSIFGDLGQGDYTAANSYMDAFAVKGQREGKNIKSINWPAWKETGMAVDYGISESENTVNSIVTERALDSFEEILNSSSAKALPGELNIKKLLKIKENLSFNLCEKFENMLEKQKVKLETESNAKNNSDSKAKIMIKGKGNAGYSETENKLAEVWSRVLEIEEIDIYDNFSALGGDSMLAIQLLKEINKVFIDMIDISDIFSYPSIQQMATYIDNKLGKDSSKKSKQIFEEGEAGNNIKDLMEGLKSGATSIDEAMKLLAN